MAAHVGELAHAARDVHDPAVAVPAHERERLLGQPPRAEEIRLEGAAHFVEVGVDRMRAPAATGDAGVVDEDVEASELTRDRTDGRDDAVLVGDVELDGAHGVAELAGRLLALREVAGADHDPIALTGELAGDLPADPAVTARDESDAVYLQSGQSQSQPDSQQSQSHAMETSFRHRHPSGIY